MAQKEQALQQIMRQSIQQYQMLRQGQCVLCALSGGADSIALLRALLAVAQQMQWRIQACHINHMLRGEEAMRDEMFVRTQCDELGVPLTVKKQDVKAYALEHKMGTEEAARQVRYALLQECAADIAADKIALAHTLDDNLETMLFHLVRGAGAQGLSGIPPVRDNLVRPLIGVTRVQVEAFLAVLAQPYVNDSTNVSTQYTRNQIRHEIIPILQKINPRCAQAAGRTAQLLRQDNAYLAMQTEMFWQQHHTIDAQGVHLSCKAIQTAPEALRGRLLRQALQASNIPMAQCTHLCVAQLTALSCSEKPSGVLQLPNEMLAMRQYDDLWIGKAYPQKIQQEIPLKVGERVPLWQSDAFLSVREVKNGQDFYKKFNTFSVDCGKINFDTLCVRTRRTGDKIQLTQTGGHRSLKRLMIDKRVPRLSRDLLAVIADCNGVIAVQGFGVEQQRKPAANAAAIIFKIEGINEG